VYYYYKLTQLFGMHSTGFFSAASLQPPGDEKRRCNLTFLGYSLFLPDHRSLGIGSIDVSHEHKTMIIRILCKLIDNFHV
jgi:hypothetical protein